MDFDTALDAGIRAGDEAMSVGGPDEASHHYQLALELLADRHRANASDVDIAALVANTARALMASGHPGRAAALVLEQLRRLPEDAPAAARARLLISRAAALDVIEPDEDPLALSAEAVGLLGEQPTALRAQALALHARLLAGEGRFDEAQDYGLDALELAERLDLGVVASDAVTTLSGLKRKGPKEALRESLQLAVRRAEGSGAIETELRGRFHLGRSHQDWAEWDDASRWFLSGLDRAEAEGLSWAPYGFEARWQLAWVRGVQGRWDEVLDLVRRRGQNPPPIAAALLEGLRLQVHFARGEDVSATLADAPRAVAARGTSGDHHQPARDRDGWSAGGSERRSRRRDGVRRGGGGDGADLARVVRCPGPPGGRGARSGRRLSPATVSSRTGRPGGCGSPHPRRRARGA